MLTLVEYSCPFYINRHPITAKKCDKKPKVKTQLFKSSTVVKFMGVTDPYHLYLEIRIKLSSDKIFF